MDLPDEMDYSAAGAFDAQDRSRGHYNYEREAIEFEKSSSNDNYGR